MNPFIELYHDPVSAFLTAAWICVLLAMLGATWWAGGRNALYLQQHYQNGWKYLVPFGYMTRLVAMLLIVAIDCLLLAAIIDVAV